MTVKEFQLFGSRRRTSILLLLGLLEESYPSELARLLDAPIFSVQTIVDNLEAEGVIVTRRLGRTRRLELNPRYPAAADLKALLEKLGRLDKEVREAAARKRARPRRAGKLL